jgi:hypothetical protein
MRALRTLIVTLLGLLLVPLVAAPASAAETCTSGGGAERCAALTPRAAGEEQFYGEVSITGLKPRFKVRVRFASLQRRTDDGWTTVTRNPSNGDQFYDGDTTATALPCAGTAPGVYRTRGKVQWKERGDDTVRSDVVVSRGLRKSRLC